MYIWVHALTPPSSISSISIQTKYAHYFTVFGRFYWREISNFEIPRFYLCLSRPPLGNTSSMYTHANRKKDIDNKYRNQRTGGSKKVISKKKQKKKIVWRDEEEEEKWKREKKKHGISLSIQFKRSSSISLNLYFGNGEIECGDEETKTQTICVIRIDTEMM